MHQSGNKAGGNSLQSSRGGVVWGNLFVCLFVFSSISPPPTGWRWREHDWVCLSICVWVSVRERVMQLVCLKNESLTKLDLNLWSSYATGAHLEQQGWNAESCRVMILSFPSVGEHLQSHTHTHPSPPLSFISSDPASVSWLNQIYILLCFSIGQNVSTGRLVDLNLSIKSFIKRALCINIVNWILFR